MTKQPKKLHLTKEHVYKLRQYHGMSLKEFAERIGISFVSVHRIETGKMKLSVKTEARIIEAFGLSVNKLRSVTIHYDKHIAGFKGSNEDE
ncbi:helix-turn-helix transcriptional regulator [Planococcus sp. S3-L1]|uniref:helix-turn-helix domain-containing protein n=1 Tax=Planococcus sp. S3-L1 TaxID=3046200 RepID=UPI0024B89EF4|nr:helix-turn-helix transcriptional regulator [Planococcus sp. S3-L1]MDJ0332120.1 helix-turn-helix transcriptional regulator [Planococcus sp. S3-L1]